MARSSERSCSRPVSPFSYALYSSFSPYFQKYLESLYAVHSAVAQADGAAAAGHTVRRDPIETIHPVVRVNPATGWKSVYVNPGTSSSASQLRLANKAHTARLHPAHRGCAEVRVRRRARPALPPNQREPRLPDPLQVGAQLDRYLGQPGMRPCCLLSAAGLTGLLSVRRS